jgi:hypothetical protein
MSSSLSLSLSLSFLPPGFYGGEDALKMMIVVFEEVFELKRFLKCGE